MNGTPDKREFLKAYQLARKNKMNKENVLAGFKGTGVWPPTCRKLLQKVAKAIGTSNLRSTTAEHQKDRLQAALDASKPSKHLVNVERAKRQVRREMGSDIGTDDDTDSSNDKVELIESDSDEGSCIEVQSEGEVGNGLMHH
ncbi:hypothetical protein Micbo1qcDRAFT_180962 [Microdochium bolleyi]|uniref:Uncharacterized protein n=1 Tax=Microdochium bolleyi TaxID=196109 RepID=A0A136IK53_9PEZI|nr:hypothetical protein Micbo1qcDRAFT_180962 [Microdochium bolleyi]